MFVPFRQKENSTSQLSTFLVASYFTTPARNPPKAQVNGGLHCFIAACFVFSVSSHIITDISPLMEKGFFFLLFFLKTFLGERDVFCISFSVILPETSCSSKMSTMRQYEGREHDCGRKGIVTFPDHRQAVNKSLLRRYVL